MKHPRWRVPQLWPGAKVALLGGGPSLRIEDAEAVRAAGFKTIAVNTAFKLAPWSDMLYFCDHEWIMQWRDAPEFRAFAGLKVALQNARTWEIDKLILVIENYGGPESGMHGLCRVEDGVHTGRSSGYQAAQLAWKLGARLALLLGFDMCSVGNRTHWHSGTADAHRRQTAPEDYGNAMIPPWKALKRDFDAEGFRVWNCTIGSALAVYPSVPLAETLAEIARDEAERLRREAKSREASAQCVFAVAGR